MWTLSRQVGYWKRCGSDWEFSLVCELLDGLRTDILEAITQPRDNSRVEHDYWKMNNPSVKPNSDCSIRACLVVNGLTCLSVPEATQSVCSGVLYKFITLFRAYQQR